MIYGCSQPRELWFIDFNHVHDCVCVIKSQFSSEGGPVYLKIADLGISRIMSPGGTMGFKGSPGFMAPEILKYVGMEAVTEKVRYMYDDVMIIVAYSK